MEVFEADISYDAEIRNLMRTIKVPGKIELMYTREPNYFHGLEIQGKLNHIALCKKNDEIAGMGCRSIRPMYINGYVRDFGYLGGLRAALHLRGGVTKMLFKHLYSLHQDGKTPAYITTVIEGNKDAMNALLKPRQGIPRYIDFGRCYFYAVNFTNRQKTRSQKSSLQIIRGDQIPLEEIIRFLNEEGRKRQFYPVLSYEDFHTSLMRDFSVNDFYIALENNTIVGIIGKWDQNKFKQIIVTDYHGGLKILLPLVNTALKLFGYKAFPNTTETINIFYVCFICIKNDNCEIMKALLDRLYQDNKNKEYHYMLIGFHEKDPLRNSLKGYFYHIYISRLYLVSWPDNFPFCNAIRRDMIPYLETAIL